MCKMRKSQGKYMDARTPLRLDDRAASILDKACSTSSGDSCAGCRNPSERSASDTWSIEMASRHCAVACARLGDACV